MVPTELDVAQIVLGAHCLLNFCCKPVDGNETTILVSLSGSKCQSLNIRYPNGEMSNDTVLGGISQLLWASQEHNKLKQQLTEFCFATIGDMVVSSANIQKQ